MPTTPCARGDKWYNSDSHQHSFNLHTLREGRRINHMYTGGDIANNRTFLREGDAKPVKLISGY